MNIGNSFNDNWLFTLEENPEFAKTGLDDSGWRSVNLPHDWSVEFSFDEEKGEGCTGYLLGGIGYYRKHFTLDDAKDKSVYIYFDGVYNNSETYINGHRLGEHPYGYSPFYCEITDYLTGGDNVLSVKVDHTRYADSRWYTGSGIYRDVELIISDKLHFDIWPTYIVTPNNNEVIVKTNLKNNHNCTQDFSLCIDIIDKDGNNIAAACSDVSQIKDSVECYTQTLNIKQPQLWNIDSAYLYTAKITILRDDKCIGEHVTKFGIRQFEFSADKGFILNGEKVHLKGVCLHHDAGLVGSAVPKDVWRRRLQGLRDGGCNAIRTSHNPPSEDFLDLCDEMGFFVKHEFFDEWDYPKDKRLNGYEQHDDYISRGYSEHFGKWGESDLKSSMYRDRNHASIFLWSLGNEIELAYLRVMQLVEKMKKDTNTDAGYDKPTWTPESVREAYEALPKEEFDIGKTAHILANWTREVDLTRPVSANCIVPSSSFESGYIDALDVAGFSYRQAIYDYAHKYYPKKPIFGGENFDQWHEWKHVIERDFVAGMFIWTGIDYMGESNEHWPAKGSASGLLDFGAFKKPPFYMFKSLWTEEPMVYLCTQTLEKSENKVCDDGSVVEKEEGKWKKRLWGWHKLNDHYNYDEGEMISAEVYSNCDSVELFLNEKSLGKKYLKDYEDRIYKWAFEYVPGKLMAVYSMDDKVIASDSKITAYDFSSLDISVDRNTMNANRSDAAHIIVQLLDSNNNPVKHKDTQVEFVVDGPCRVLGVDTGAATNVQDYQATKLVTSQGRALMIIKSTREAGTITIKAKTDKLESKDITINVK